MEKFRVKEVTVVYLTKPQLNNPVLIEGLPGVGNVGKLAAEHLVDEIKATKFAEIYSSDFPPQVFVNGDGTIKIVKNELYYCKREKEEKDIIILTGDFQGTSSKGQYILTEKMLDIAEKFGVTMIYTLGGYGVGLEIEKPHVIGAVTHVELAEKLKNYKVRFRDEGGGIVGASGLLLGLGAIRGFKGVCLMGETSGYIVDPNSAREVIKVLSKMLGLKIGLKRLNEKANEVKRLTDKIKNLEKSLVEKEGKEDLRYIG